LNMRIESVIVFQCFNWEGLRLEHEDRIFGVVFRFGVVHLAPMFLILLSERLSVVICLSIVMVAGGLLGRLLVELLISRVRGFSGLGIFVIRMGLFVMFVYSSTMLMLLFALLILFRVKSMLICIS